MEPIAVTSKTELFNGDVLVTKTKGHTVVVVSGNPRRGNAYYPKYEGASGSIIDGACRSGRERHIEGAPGQYRSRKWNYKLRIYRSAEHQDG